MLHQLTAFTSALLMPRVKFVFCRLCLQTEAEIRAVVQEAQKNSVMNPAGWEVSP